MCMLVQTMQASALLACVGERCPTATPTNAVRVPRYRSIAIPTRRSPEFASYFSRPSRIAQGDMMGISILHSRLMIEDPWCSMIQTLKRPSRDRDLPYEQRGSRYQSRDHAIMSRTLGLVSGYIDTALHRVKVMSPQAQQNWVS